MLPTQLTTVLFCLTTALVKGIDCFNIGIYMNTNQFIPYQVYESKVQPNFHAILKQYLYKWPWFLLSLILCLAAAYVYLLYQMPIYNVKASVLVKDEKKGISEQMLMKEMNVFTESKVMENEMEILKSYTLMGRVIKHLGLTVRYSHPTSTYKKEIYQESPIRLIVENPVQQLYTKELVFSFVDDKTVKLNGELYPVNQSVQTPYGQLRIFTRQPLNSKIEPVYVSVMSDERAIETFLSRLKVEPTAKLSTMLALTIQDPIPSRGEAILNQLINEYNSESINDKNTEARNTLRFIEDRMTLISGELFNVEKQVESYKSAHGITDLSIQAETFLIGIKDNDQRLNEVNMQLDALKAIETYIGNRSDKEVYAPAILGLNDPVLKGLLEKMAELDLKREDMAKTVPADHPIYQSIDSQLKNLRVNINDNVKTIRKQLQGNRAELVYNNQRIENNMRTLPGKERTLLDITRQQSVKNSLYTYLLQKREETALSAASAISTSRTVDAAHTDSQPVKPIRMMIFALSTLLSFLLPIGIITAKDTLGNHIMLRSDVEEVTQVPILGEVVKSTHEEGNTLVFKSNVQSVISEQIRTLRTNLQFSPNGMLPNRIFLFTSSISGEGKSFIASNLGACFALIGRKTVVIDMDMRKPKLHKNLFIENRVGLSDYLRGDANIDELLHGILGYESYYAITAGTLPTNPSELLNSSRMAELFTELKNRFEYVLVDSPPIGLVADSQLIAPYVDATIFVVRHDYTPKNYVKMVDTLNKEQRFPNLSIVLNGVSKGAVYNYSYNYDGYKQFTRKS